MYKFEVGDRVKIVRDVSNEGHPHVLMDVEGVVMEIDEYDERLTHCISFRGLPETWWCSEDDLEFVIDDDDLL